MNLFTISFAFIIKTYNYKKSRAAFDMYRCRQQPNNKQTTQQQAM